MTKRSAASKAKRTLKETVNKHFPFMLIHTGFCNAVAFYLHRMPEVGKPVMPEEVMYPDGSMPQQGQGAYCFTCKEQLGHEALAPENVRRVQ